MSCSIIWFNCMKLSICQMISMHGLILHNRERLQGLFTSLTPSMTQTSQCSLSSSQGHWQQSKTRSLVGKQVQLLRNKFHRYQVVGDKYSDFVGSSQQQPSCINKNVKDIIRFEVLFSSRQLLSSSTWHYYVLLLCRWDQSQMSDIKLDLMVVIPSSI